MRREVLHLEKGLVPGDEPVLEGLHQALLEGGEGKGLKRPKLGVDPLGEVEGPHQVLPLGQVDPGLPPTLASTMAKVVVGKAR